MIAQFLYICVLNALVSAHVPDSGENVDLVQTNLGGRSSEAIKEKEEAQLIKKADEAFAKAFQQAIKKKEERDKAPSLVQGKDDVAKKAAQEDEEGYDYGEQPMAEPLHQHRAKGKAKGKGHGDESQAKANLLKVAGKEGKTRTAEKMESEKARRLSRWSPDAGNDGTKHHSRAAGKGKGKGKGKKRAHENYDEDSMLKNSALKDDISSLESDIFKSADHPENYDEFMDHDKIWDISPSLVQGKTKETSNQDKAKSVVRDMARSKDVQSVVRDMQRSEADISPWEVSAGQSRSKAEQWNNNEMMKLTKEEKEYAVNRYHEHRREAIDKLTGKAQAPKYDGSMDMRGNQNLKAEVDSMEDSIFHQTQAEDWDAWRDHGHDVYDDVASLAHGKAKEKSVEVRPEDDSTKQAKHHGRGKGKGKGKGKQRAHDNYDEDSMLKNSALKDDVSSLESDIFNSADHPENYDEFMDHDKIWDIQK